MKGKYLIHNFCPVGGVFIFALILIASGCVHEKQTEESPIEIEQLIEISQDSPSLKLVNPDSVIETVGFIKQEIETNLASNEVYQLKAADSSQILLFKDGEEVVKISRISKNESFNAYYHEGLPVLIVDDQRASTDQSAGFVEKWYYFYYDSLIHIEVDDMEEDIYRVASLARRRKVSVTDQERKRIGQLYSQRGQQLISEHKKCDQVDGRYQFMISQEVFGEYVTDSSFYFKNGIKLKLLNIPVFTDWESFINGLLPQFPCYLQFQTENLSQDLFRVYPQEMVINDDQFSFYVEHDLIGKITLYGTLSIEESKGKVLTGKIKVEGEEAESIILQAGY